ncbi:MAG: ferritin family protein [Candidatus Eisenbacteria bacterium]|uniref:Ferritin family protein n=1 Tax=Eiseniibacteriota bacterium TaxID=2212470 RepID=A0A948RXQ7_UNCEI|nr:ferritin family protein [Candidatus Eisenbacteria bacterium]MBU1951268.1 ferritin family protein [Candidatus Eisenbacteria bacterium]MBU2691002.1 ferritin family protein [Candidatus Eisenbacteria bacterium]
MQSFGSIDEILDFAIAREVEAAKFYQEMSGRVKRDAMKDLFRDFANEERRHKAKLEKVKQGKLLLISAKKIQDLKIAEYTEEIDMSSGAEFNYQQALIVAMQREKNAFKLYSDLAKLADDEGVRNLLLELANEEAKHKLYFETEYDNHILTEN